jgi:hypothetical protein
MDAACRKMPGAKGWRWPTSGPHSKGFPELNKAPNQILGGKQIARKRGKIQEKHGGRKSNLEHFLLLQLLPNLYIFQIIQQIPSQN